MSSDENTADERSQGGQSRTNQPQGDQPQGGQPQGGQAYGQTQQPVQQGPGLADKLQQEPTFGYLKATVSMYALVGLGIGLIALLVGGVGEELLSVSGGGESEAAHIGTNVIATAVGALPLFGAVLAVGVGTRFAEEIPEDDQTVAIAAAVAVFAGTIALWILGAFLASTQLTAELYNLGALNTNTDISISLEFGALLISSIVAGIGTAVIGGGTAYIERTFLPE